jgi:hypothetical protein
LAALEYRDRPSAGSITLKFEADVAERCRPTRSVQHWTAGSLPG